MSEEAKDLIGCILQENPTKRATPSEILAHSWIQKPALQQAQSIDVQLDDSTSELIRSVRMLMLPWPAWCSLCGYTAAPLLTSFCFASPPLTFRFAPVCRSRSQRERKYTSALALDHLLRPNC